MKLQLERPIVVFDLETTGVQITRDRIVEISILKVHPDGEEETKTRRINPGIPIPPEATQVHGISDADVADCPTFAQVASISGSTGVTSWASTPTASMCRCSWRNSYVQVSQ